MSQCIYCGSTQALNTQLTITVDDGIKHTVDICDTHAEDASIKSAKAAFLDKQQKIQEVLEQAKALGLNISQTGDLVVASSPDPHPPAAPASEAAPAPEPEPAPAPTPQPQVIQAEQQEGEDWVSTDVVDRSRPISSVGGNTQMGNVESYGSHNTESVKGELPADALKGKVKMAVVEGREGQPLAVPQQRVDGTGTTRISILKTEDDRSLQERFKKMASDSMNDQTPDFARSGYANTTANCPICHGDGEVRMGKSTQICPKCGGGGVISTS